MSTSHVFFVLLDFLSSSVCVSFHFTISHLGCGEALLSFRRAPRGLAMRRCRAGVTTQKRLRSPPPGMLGPRPSPLMIAAKTPSQCTMHASERTRDRAASQTAKSKIPKSSPTPRHQEKQRTPSLLMVTKAQLFSLLFHALPPTS